MYIKALGQVSDGGVGEFRVFSDSVAERHRIEAFVLRTGALSPEMYRKELAKLLVKLGYQPNYVLGDLETELRRARCEARMNTSAGWRRAAEWRWMVPNISADRSPITMCKQSYALGPAIKGQPAVCLERVDFATSRVLMASRFE